MTARDRGTIVQVGSALAYRAIPLQAAYCGAKFAIRGFTDSIRTELLHDKSNVQITMVQLPGVNTTQFNWCRSKLPDHPMPVPPIYQPEIPAEAVYWAAQHRRRELWVGYSAVQAILGNKLAPSFADWYLAKTAISGQQVHGMPVDRPPDNLFEPVPSTRPPRTASSTTRPRPAARSCGATHPPAARRRRAGRRGLGAAGAAVARDECDADPARPRARRTSCASTRCWPTVSAASSSARAATSSGCASRAGTPTPSSPR